VEVLHHNRARRLRPLKDARRGSRAVVKAEVSPADVVAKDEEEGWRCGVGGRSGAGAARAYF